ncbi:hypothetical protein HAX54_020557 [Datura stramonium]|uniref:Uncharacterized protein n=1 Tax=Datura stramonium TaxID=4076 RepID=A0ABS8UU59_DATST|nr:hypothetical protein [Datura stramonium]
MFARVKFSGWEVDFSGGRPEFGFSLCLPLNHELIAWNLPSAVYISFVVCKLSRLLQSAYPKDKDCGCKKKEYYERWAWLGGGVRVEVCGWWDGGYEGRGEDEMCWRR